MVLACAGRTIGPGTKNKDVVMVTIKERTILSCIFFQRFFPTIWIGFFVLRFVEESMDDDSIRIPLFKTFGLYHTSSQFRILFFEKHPSKFCGWAPCFLICFFSCPMDHPFPRPKRWKCSAPASGSAWSIFGFWFCFLPSCFAWDGSFSALGHIVSLFGSMSFRLILSDLYDTFGFFAFVDNFSLCCGYIFPLVATEQKQDEKQGEDQEQGKHPIIHLV